MNKVIEILIGLILLILPIYAWITNFGGWDLGYSALVILKGGFIWLSILLGIVFLILGISDLKN